MGLPPEHVGGQGVPGLVELDHLAERHELTRRPGLPRGAGGDLLRQVEPEESAEDAAAEGPSEEEHPAMEHKVYHFAHATGLADEYNAG